MGLMPKDSCNCAYDGPNPIDNPGDFIYGVDISHWQGNIARTPGDLSDSLHFIICKATEGETFVDSEFLANKKYLDSTKKFSGYYHFYRCNDSPRTQAKFYSDTVGKFNKWNLPPIVDVEYVAKGAQCNGDSDMDSLLVFLKEVERLTQMTPIIYTNYDFGHTHFPKHPSFADYPLWVASFGTEQPNMFGPWEDWTFWQMTDHYAVGNDSIDLDIFHGDTSHLQIFIDSSRVGP